VQLTAERAIEDAEMRGGAGRQGLPNSGDREEGLK